ncbi:MAG TPA: cytochrome c [Xanthobacteraceae bacterium]|jgi:mono/diheme cytochrome c family protein
MFASGRSLALFFIVSALTSGLTRAQDLDRGKSGAQLFAASCADCHHSPHGLAKDRFSWTLSYFLQQHYTTGPAMAHTLTAYLESVDVPRSTLPPAARKRPTPPSRPPTPPLPVPER